MKFGDVGIRFSIFPPVTNKKPPMVATKKPIILNLLSFSLKKNNAKIVINTGASKQTNKAGKEGPNI